MKYDQQRSGIFERICAGWIHTIDQHTIFMIYIDPERFKKERREARMKQLTANNPILDDAEKVYEEFSLNFSNSLESIIRIFKLKRWNMFWMLLNLSFVLYDIYKCFIFGVFDSTRNSETQRYENPILRAYEGYVLYDIMRPLIHSKQCNRVMFVIHLSQLFVKFYMNRNIIKSEIINRHQYTRVNSVQFPIIYMCNITNTPRDWIKFIRLALKHKCDYHSLEAEKQILKMEKLNSLTRKMSKLDRYYYYNHFDFTHCYKDIPLYVYRLNCGPTIASCDFARNVPLAAGYIPKPLAAMDPIEMVFLLFVSVIAMIGLGLVSLLVFIIITWLNCTYSLTLTIGNAIYTPIYVSLLIYVLICNLANISPLMVITGAYVSHSRRLCHLLEDLHQQIEREYIPLVISQHDKYQTKSPTRRNRRQNQLSWSLPQVERPISGYMQSSGFTLDSNDVIQSKGDNNVSRSIDHIIPVHFIALRLKYAQKLKHLLDLIEVLRVELDDVKEIMTSYINIYCVSGTIMLALSISILQDSERFTDRILILIMNMIIMLPIVYSLTIGAVSEYMVS